MNVNLLRGRLLFFALACMALPSCGGGGSNDDPAPIADPGPGPGPEPGPGPSSKSGWVLQDGGSELDLNVVSAGDSSHVCTAENNASTPFIQGVLRRTVDGGSTWSSLGPIPENQSVGVLGGNFPSVLKMQFLDELTGWALTRFSVLSTTDGGLTWVTRLNTLVSHWSAMSFISATTGWITSDNYGGISKTTDGGETWTHYPVGGDSYSAGRALQFVDDQTGWIALRRVDSGEEVHKTTDGGITWQQQLFIGGEDPALVICDIAAVGPNRVWVVGEINQDEVMFASTDGGVMWTQQQSDGSSGIRAVHFVDADNGWAVGRKIHHTVDGGVTWTVQPTKQEWFRDVVFIDATTGWAVGEKGVILKTTTGGIGGPASLVRQ